MLAHPDAIEQPREQIVAARVFVAERDSAIVGFSAVLPRDDGDTGLDAWFVEPNIWRRGLGRLLVEYCANACGFKMTGTVKTRFGVDCCYDKCCRRALAQITGWFVSSSLPPLWATMVSSFGSTSFLSRSADSWRITR